MRRYEKELAVGAALALVFAGLGCSTIGNFQTANTLGKGRFQLALEPAFVGEPNSEGGLEGYPRLDVAARFGVSDNIDISARVGGSLFEVGAEVGAKVQLTDHAEKAFALSIAPSVGGLYSPGYSSPFAAINATLPFLVGIGVGESSQFVFGPKLYNLLIIGNSTSLDDLMMLGGTVGYSAALTKGFRLMPELSIVFPIVACGSTSSSINCALAKGVYFQGGVGILFGGG